MTIQRIESQNLILRGARKEDFLQFAQFYTSERAVHAGGIKTKREAWNILAANIGHWDLNGFGMFVITRKESDLALGIVGPYYPFGWPEKEVGWVLFNSKSEGQGIAFEAAKTAIEHVWQCLGWNSIVSYIHPENQRSIALAERLGATIDEGALIPKPDVPCLVFRHSPKGEFRE